MATTKSDTLKRNGVNKDALKERAAEMADDAKERATTAATAVKEKSVDAWEAGKDKMDAAHNTFADGVRRNPTAAILGAVGVGVLIGLAVNRKA